MKHIPAVIERAYRIKNQFESVASNHPNFFNLTGLNSSSPNYTATIVSHKAWQEAQRNLVFAKSSFDEYSRRVKKMNDAFSELSSAIAKGDAQALQSMMTLPNLKMEISTLKKEVSALGAVEGQAAIKNEMQKKLELLQNFQESILAAQDKIASEKITDYIDKQSVYGQAKKDFQKVLKHLSKKNDTILFDETTNEAFGILTDNLEMRNEMQGLAQSINVLNSPNGFLKLQSRIFEALETEAKSENRIQRIRDNIGKFYAMNDENEVIQSLGKLGLKLPEEFIEEYKAALDKGEDLPTTEAYLDPSTGEEIDYLNDPDRYLKADEVWQAFKYWMTENRKKTPEQKAAAQKSAQDAIIAMQFDPSSLAIFPPELAENLQAMHLTAVTSGTIAADQTLKEFVETNNDALTEIKIYMAGLADKTDWAKLIEDAVDDDALNAIVDQMDTLPGSMTPDLLIAISKKRDALKQNATKAAATYSAVFFNTPKLVGKYKPVHPTLYAHHSTIEFKPADITGLPIGEEITIKIIGRLTTDKVDVLLVENPLSKNKYPHITLSTALGVKPFESNSEIENNLDKIQPLDDTIQGVVGIFKDGKEITEAAPKEKPTKTEEPELTPVEKLEKEYKEIVEKETAYFRERMKAEKKPSTKRRIGRQMAKRLVELEKQHKRDLKALGVVEKRKKIEPPRGPGYHATLSGGRTAKFNPETGNWDFRKNTGKIIGDKEVINQLAKELSNQGNLVKLWWTEWLTKDQRESVKDDLLTYLHTGQGSGMSAYDAQENRELYLLENLSGVKFNPKGLEGQVTDVMMSAWVDPNSDNHIDTYFSEEALREIGITERMGDSFSTIIEIIQANPEGITNTDVKNARESLLSKANRDETLRDDFINSYGINPDIAYRKLDTADLMNFGEKPGGGKDFTDIPIPKKFDIAVEDLKNHQILQGTLTMNAPTQIVQNDKTYDLGKEYVYQVTLDDGRTFPVSSEFYFAPNIPRPLYTNKPRVRLVLAEFNGKPAVEVRIMEPGYNDQRISYIREKDPKATKPITYPLSQEDVETGDIFYYLDMTLEEMNKNISAPILVVAKQKGYDVIYNNVPYLVTRVDQKGVSLKDIDQKTITVNISDITEIRDGKGIIKSKIDEEIAKINQAAANSILTTLNDIPMDVALKNIKTNKCNNK